MRGIENILPPEHQFDTTLDEVRDLVVDALDACAVDVGDIIHPEIEFSGPYQEYWKLSEFMAGLFASEDENQESVRLVLYRGLCFGFQTVHEIKESPIQKISMDIFSQEGDFSQIANTIHAQVQEYISARPNIDSFIGMFIPELVGEHVGYEHHVETAAGLVFMLCEQEAGDEYMRARIESLEPEAF